MNVQIQKQKNPATFFTHDYFYLV